MKRPDRQLIRTCGALPPWLGPGEPPHDMSEPLDRKAKPQRQLFSSLLFWKYVALFVGAIGLALVTDSMINIWFTTREHRADLVRFQKEQASAAAARISQFIRAIAGQLGWTTQLSWAS